MATEKNVSEVQEAWKDRNTVAGLFSVQEKAEQAVRELKAAGIEEKRIGLATDESGVKHQSGFWDRARSMLGDRDKTKNLKDFESSLKHSGIPEGEARYFGQHLRAGMVLVTVHTDPQHVQEAARILQQNGGNIGSSAPPLEAGAKPTARQPRPVAQEGPSPVEDERQIELLGEVLRVYKERIPRGEVTIRKEVVTEPQHLEVPVTREELVVERHAVDQQRPAEGRIGGEKEIRVPLTEERVKVEKRPVVREEVKVGTKPVKETRDVSESTRREELKVERKEEPESEKSVRPEDRKRIA